MSLNIFMCEIALITSESTKSSLQLFLLIVGTLLFRDVSGDASEEQLAWWKVESRTSQFLKIEKIALIMGTKCPDCVHPWIKCSSMLSFKMLF